MLRVRSRTEQNVYGLQVVVSGLDLCVCDFLNTHDAGVPSVGLHLLKQKRGD